MHILVDYELGIGDTNADSASGGVSGDSDMPSVLLCHYKQSRPRTI